MRLPRPVVAVLLAVVVTGCAGIEPSSAPTAALSTPPASGSAPCPITEQSGRLPSNRLVSADVESTAVADRITFRFDEPSDVIAEPEGRLREVRPPFFEAGSGEVVAVTGERFVEVRFEGMLLFDENGTPTFQGERSRRLDLRAIVEVVIVEEFEGYVTWIVGIRGPGCVSLGGDPGGVVTLDVLHG